MKRLLKAFCLFLFFILTVFLIEAGIYYRILKLKKPPPPVDAVVVFNGAPARNKEGYRLVNDGMAPILIVSPANAATQKKYDSAYGYTGKWQHLTEDRADTTFQNALLTGRLIKQHRFQKIILVTDSWHMPRSYLLLRMMLIGSDVEIIPNKIGTESYDGSPIKWETKVKKQIYNELVELWGSIFEMGLYFAQGKLPEKSLKERAWVKTLRNVLLAEV